MTTITLSIVGGVKVVVPNSLELITPYVLCEQQDWFEDEIRFVRRLLGPGQKAIDIGANYGVFTLSMAQRVGAGGHVWAYEPASRTAGLLAQAIAANSFTQVTLEQYALSAQSGEAQLWLHPNSELNGLARGLSPDLESEAVSVVTLDDRLEAHGWTDIDFIKIDAEGEEANILKGGTRFFTELSPLVLYELKAGTELHLELVQNFARLGYESYRLVPGLGILVPFTAESAPDDYLLNLFCCKPDRAARLAQSGYLTSMEGADARRQRLKQEIRARGTYEWRRTTATLPYGTLLAAHWDRTMGGGNGSDLDQALSFYAASGDRTLNVADRCCALEASLSLFKTLCDDQPSQSRLASLARTAKEFGARSLAVDALSRLADTISSHGKADIGEPFLSPNARFDQIPPDQAIGNWLLAAVLEEFERSAAFSSYYSGAAARPRLELICKLGYANEEMHRRLALVRQRFDP